MRENKEREKLEWEEGMVGKQEMRKQQLKKKSEEGGRGQGGG